MKKIMINIQSGSYDGNSNDVLSKSGVERAKALGCELVGSIPPRTDDGSQRKQVQQISMKDLENDSVVSSLSRDRCYHIIAHCCGYTAKKIFQNNIGIVRKNFQSPDGKYSDDPKEYGA